MLRPIMLIHGFAKLTVLGLAGLLIFAVVVFALAFYAREDIRHLSEHYQKLAPLQKAMQTSTPSLWTSPLWREQFLPRTLKEDVDINASGTISFHLRAETALPEKFNQAILIVNPSTTPSAWTWSCQFKGHPEWQAYLPITCANATAPPIRRRPFQH